MPSQKIKATVQVPITNSLKKNRCTTILLVEDNFINQKITIAMLGKLGYGCDVAENGQLGLEALASKSYTLVFMDLMMPVMDGITATKEIIKIYGEDAPIIVAITANAFEEDIERCFEAGMKDFIAKPVQVIELKRVLTIWEQPESQKMT